jgi:hypothetical protein
MAGAPIVNEKSKKLLENRRKRLEEDKNEHEGA